MVRILGFHYHSLGELRSCKRGKKKIKINLEIKGTDLAKSLGRKKIPYYIRLLALSYGFKLKT